jgi:hypothetical protein
MMRLFKQNHLRVFKGKIISLLLLTIMLFSVCGYFVLFNLAQNQIQREIKSRIRHGLIDSELTIIEVTVQNATEIRWIKPGKEFTYRGNMYDVVTVTEKNGKTLLKCINDIREKKLIRDFAKNAESSQKARKLINNISLTYIFQEEFYHNINETSNHEYYTRPNDLASKIIEIADPPPKSIL